MGFMARRISLPADFQPVFWSGRAALSPRGAARQGSSRRSRAASKPCPARRRAPGINRPSTD